MRFHILTLFPDMVEQGLNTSIIGRAVEKGILSIEAVNIRDYTLDRHKKVDDYPYGGGAGMVMQAQPIYDAWQAIVTKIGYRPRTVYLTPQGPTFHQGMAKEYAKEEDLILLCGHYEGVDQRALDLCIDEEISIGDNDTLSAMVAASIRADLLILLSDIDGLYDSDPHENPDARLIPVVERLDDHIRALAGGSGSSLGTGGMVTKLQAAQIATEAGCEMVIANGHHPAALYDIAAGQPAGTRFLAGRKEL